VHRLLVLRELQSAVETTASLAKSALADQDTGYDIKTSTHSIGRTQACGFERKLLEQRFKMDLQRK